MRSIRLNHSFLNSIRNLIFASLILFLLPLTLSFAQDGRDSIQLSPLHTDAEKLAVLLQIKEKVPNLFSDAAQYDIDLFALLEDEEKLLKHLKSNPKYLELFQQKKYHEIQITPPPGGLQIGELSINPEAIQKWKDQLKNNLNHFKLQQEAGLENTNPLKILDREITAKVQSITEANSLLDGNGLLKDLGKIKANQAILNPALKKIGSKTLSERLSTALIIYDQLPEKPSYVSEEMLRKALEIEQNRENLKSLIELHSVLGRRGQNVDPTHQTWQTAEASLNELKGQDLNTLQDKKDYLGPIIKKLIPSSYPELQENMLNGIHKNVSSFATVTVSSEKKAIDPVTISQQHPIFGIFRGCTGGDCSSRYSFPYPNDPNEKVLFIIDKDHKVKGYVSATQVMANGKPSLYVISVSGNRVTSADTELILRGLEKEKAELGVEQILLPAQKNIESLINFPAPRSVYNRYTADQPTVRIHYNNPEIRNDIQSYASARGYNQGQYDHMDRNSQAVVLSFKNNSENEKIATRVQELPIAPLQVTPLNRTMMSKVFEFLLDLKRSGRQELEEKVLQIDTVKQFMNSHKYQELTHFLSKAPSEKSITVQEFKTLLSNKLSELDHSLSDYLEKNPSLVYPAVFSCNDAFSPENIDETAKYAAKHLKHLSENFQEDDPAWSNQIEQHLTELNNTKYFQKFTKDLLNHLQSTDPTARKNAVYWLGEIKPSDPAIHSMISQVALHNADKSVRLDAFKALEIIKPTDPEIHSKILNIALLQLYDKGDRQMAFHFLSEIKPTEPTSHLKILEVALQDPDQEVRFAALDTLSKIKPTDLHIHKEILNLVQDSNERMRIKAFRALAEIKPTDLSIQSEILNIALQNSDGAVKKAAFDTLISIKPTDLSIQLRLSNLLQDPHNEIKSSVLRVLTEIKPTNSSIHSAILQVALDDPNRLIRRYALKFLIRIKLSDAEVNKKFFEDLLKSVIDRKASEERDALIQVLEGTDFSNHIVREALRTELLKNLNKLNDRQDLLPIIHKVMLPASLQKSVDENRCQTLNTILSHQKNLKSLIEFFSSQSGALGISRSSHQRVGEDSDPLPIPPPTTKAHVNPPLAPNW